MPINLTISADSVEEFDTLLARFARSGDTAVHAATMPEVRAAAAPTPQAEAPAPNDTGIAGMSVADVKTAAGTADRATLDRMLAEEQGGKKRAGAISAIQAAIQAAIAAAPTQQPDGTPITPTPEPTPQPTPGGTDAPPAESIPPNQGNAGATAAVDPFATNGAGAASTTETASPTPSATSPADQAAAAGGEVTIQQLKDAMAALLKAKSASAAMAALEQASGCKSLTTGSPSVVEKAKDDPTLMRKVLDALNAAAAA